MLDLITLISANGLSEELNICRKNEEYVSRGNIFNDEVSQSVQAPIESVPKEPGMIDAGMDMFNSFVSKMLRGLPEMTSVDLSMENIKGKGQ